ncbi:hypothetical protein EON65_12650 [archaeon]|nr:MAG: hypothetical protein EON65_12650 [archaeon]
MVKTHVWLCFLLLTVLSCQTRSVRVRKVTFGLTGLHELTAENVTANLVDWDHDQAIMFMAPWCKYCKQLLPSWESIAQLTKSGEGSLSVGTFNCEKNPTHRELCISLQVDRYPSIYFVGYGNFHQMSLGKRGFNQPRYENLVKYVGDLYPEALYDWVVMLTFFSNMHRKWEDFTGIFTGRTRHMKKLASMQKLLIKAEKKANLFGKELEKYKANEVFDSLVNHGDVFPLLNKLDPDEVRIFSPFLGIETPLTLPSPPLCSFLLIPLSPLPPSAKSPPPCLCSRHGQSILQIPHRD